MDSRLLSSVAIATVFIPLLSGSSLSNLPELTSEHNITIFNGSDNEILKEIYATPTEQGDFGENLIYRGLEPFEEVNLAFSVEIEGGGTVIVPNVANECSLDVWWYDFLFVFGDGNEVRDYGINVCEIANSSYIVDYPLDVEDPQVAADIFTIYNGTKDTIKDLRIQISDGPEQSLFDSQFSLNPYNEVQVFSRSTRELAEQLNDICQQERYEYSLSVTSRGPEPVPLDLHHDLCGSDEILIMPQSEDDQIVSSNLDIDTVAKQTGRATYVKVENRDEEWLLWELYATPTSVNNWGYDLLGEAFFESEESQELVVLQPDGEEQCLFDILAIFVDPNNLGNSRRKQMPDVDICNDSIGIASESDSTISKHTPSPAEKTGIKPEDSNGIVQDLKETKMSRRRNRGRKGNGCNASRSGWWRICLPWSK